jgi:hypothetical protein
MRGTYSATQNEDDTVDRNRRGYAIRDVPNVVRLGSLSEKEAPMKTIEWAAVVAVIGVGVGSQLLRHDHDAMTGHDHGSAMNMEMAGENQATVTLAITGMT